MRFFATGIVTLSLLVASASAHFDVSPYLVGGQLMTGGRDHGGTAYPPPISVYGYDFGEEPLDPFNVSDPGVNQGAGVGGLPAGAALRYNIASSLLYWNGIGAVDWSLPPAGSFVELSMNSAKRTLTGTSGPQTGSLIQSVAADGSVHRHFVTSLFAAAGASNVPGDLGYVPPADGIYAFNLSLTLSHGGTDYVSDPFWIVFNNGLSQSQHDAAMEAIPEPASAVVALAMGAMAALRRTMRPAD